MVKVDETANSYKTTADLLIRKLGEKDKVIDCLFMAASLYGTQNKEKAMECLSELHKNLKGSTTEIEMNDYFRFLNKLAKSYEDLKEPVKAGDIYSEIAKEFYKGQDEVFHEDPFRYLKNLKKFSGYLAKALLLYDSAERYDSILKLARTYYKNFPLLQENEQIHGELFFCYEHIIHAADMTGSRYFREYYGELDKKLREV